MQETCGLRELSRDAAMLSRVLSRLAAPCRLCYAQISHPAGIRTADLYDWASGACNAAQVHRQVARQGRYEGVHQHLLLRKGCTPCRLEGGTGELSFHQQQAVKAGLIAQSLLWHAAFSELSNLQSWLDIAPALCSNHHPLLHTVSSKVCNACVV